MYWPRLQLTASEQARWAVYSEPKKLQRAVMYRAYAGELRLTTTTPEDIENIQISRRARIFALTASGDCHNVEIQLYDSSGEQYTMGFTPFANLLMGLNIDARSQVAYNGYQAAGVGPSLIPGRPLGTFNGGGALAPHVFEPNIVLSPNQTLSVKGRALNPPQTLYPDVEDVGGLPREEVIFVSFVMHAWEFPLE